MHMMYSYLTVYTTVLCICFVLFVTTHCANVETVHYINKTLKTINKDQVKERFMISYHKEGTDSKKKLNKLAITLKKKS